MPETTANIDETLNRSSDNLTTPKWDALMELLAEDAVMEFPYHLPGFPEKLTGKQQIVPYFSALKDRLLIEQVSILKMHKTIDPNVVIVESEAKGKAVQTGLPYEPKYITVLTFRDGLILRWQDYWNPFTVLTALGGAISLPTSNS